MKITRHYCERCCDDVLFTGMTHVRCGYTLPVIPVRDEISGTGRRGSLTVAKKPKKLVARSGKPEWAA